MGGIHAAYSPVKSLAPALALKLHTSARTSLSLPLNPCDPAGPTTKHQVALTS